MPALTFNRREKPLSFTRRETGILEPPEPIAEAPDRLPSFGDLLRTGEPGPGMTERPDIPSLGAAGRGIRDMVTPGYNPPEGPTFEDLPVIEPGYGAKTMGKILYAPFAPMGAVLRSPGAYTEADVGGDPEAIERPEASILDAMGEVARRGGMEAEVRIRRALGEPDLSPEELAKVGDLNAKLASLAAELTAYHFYAGGVLRLGRAAVGGVQKALRQYLTNRGFKTSEAEQMAAFFADDAAGNAMNRIIEESIHPEEVDAAARAFERKYGWRHPKDPRGPATRAERAKARATREQPEPEVPPAPEPEVPPAPEEAGPLRFIRQEPEPGVPPAPEPEVPPAPEPGAPPVEAPKISRQEMRKSVGKTATIRTADLEGGHKADLLPDLPDEITGEIVLINPGGDLFMVQTDRPIAIFHKGKREEFTSKSVWARRGDIIEMGKAAPEGKPVTHGPSEPVVTAAGTPYKSERGAKSNLARVAKKFRVPIEQLKVIEVPGGFGIVDARVEPSPPEPVGVPKKPVEEPPVAEAPVPPVEPEAPAEEPKGATMFYSGASRINDLKGTFDAGRPAGVIAGELSKPAEKALVERVNTGKAKVMIDSGAYQAYQAGKPFTEKQWDKILSRYEGIVDEVNDTHRGNLTFVAPDVVGDQMASLELLQKYGDRINELIEEGVNIIVPLQKGDKYSLYEVWNIAYKLIGSQKFFVGLPSAKEVVSLDDIKDLLDHPMRPRKIHFLGIGKASAAELQERVDLVNKYVDNAVIGIDATEIRRKMADITKERKKERFLIAGERVNALMDKHPDLLKYIGYRKFLDADEVKELAAFLDQDVDAWVKANEKRALGDLLIPWALRAVQDDKNAMWGKIEEMLQWRERDKPEVAGKARRKAVEKVLTDPLEIVRQGKKEIRGPFYDNAVIRDLFQAADNEAAKKSPNPNRVRAFMEQAKLLAAGETLGEISSVIPFKVEPGTIVAWQTRKPGETLKEAAVLEIIEQEDTLRYMKAVVLMELPGAKTDTWFQGRFAPDQATPDGYFVLSHADWRHMRLHSEKTPIKKPKPPKIDVGPAALTEDTSVGTITWRREKREGMLFVTVSEGQPVGIADIAHTSRASTAEGAIIYGLNKKAERIVSLRLLKQPASLSKWVRAKSGFRDFEKLKTAIGESKAGKIKLKVVPKKEPKITPEKKAEIDKAMRGEEPEGPPTVEPIDEIPKILAYQDPEGWIYRVDLTSAGDYAIWKTKDIKQKGKRAFRGMKTKYAKIFDQPDEAQIILNRYAVEKGWTVMHYGAKTALAQPETIALEPIFETTGDTLAQQKKEATAWIDEQIKGMKANKIPEGGFVKIRIGPAELEIHHNVDSLTALRRGLSALTRQYGKRVGKYKLPPKPKKMHITRGALKKPEYAPIAKAPKGKPVLWTDGTLIDHGKPPPGATSMGGTGEVEYEKVAAFLKEVEPFVGKPELKAVRVKYWMDESGKPYRLGSLINKQGDEIGAAPRAVGYFMEKYPDAEFYFKPEKEIIETEVPIRDDEGKTTGWEKKETERSFGDIAVVSEGKLVGMFRSLGEVPNFAFEVNEKGELIKGADWGEADFLEKKGPYEKTYGYHSMGTYATGAEQYAAPLAAVIDLPEIVEMARLLMGGKLPRVVKYIDKMGLVAGRFYAAGLGRIIMRADLFADIAQARAVLAHEIGHLVDYLPDHIIKGRGNILGRIAKLKNFRKQILARAPGLQADLTKADRDRLRRLAKKLVQEEYKDKWIDEEIEETMPISPEDVLAIWNAIADAKLINPELYKFIAELSTVEKKAIVKEALKGAVDVQLRQFAKTVKTKTGKRIKAELPEDAVATKYAELLNKEIEKLKAFKVDEMMDELKALTRTWKPFDPLADAGYTSYRYRGSELYADAISVLFNAPGLLKSMAPNFWEGLFNYMERNPQFKELYQQIQDDINSGEVDRALVDRTYGGYRRGDDAYAMSLKRRVSLGDMFMREIVDQHWALIKPVKRWLKEGHNLTADQNPRFHVEKMMMQGSEAEWMLGQAHHGVIRRLEKVGLTWDNFGLYRMLKRISTSPDAEKAAPLGWTKERAEKVLDDLASTTWAGERWRAMQEADESFNKMRLYLIDKAEASGRYPQDFIDMMREKVGDYVTFDIAKYVEQREGSAPTSKIYPRMGSFEDITNPATATILKDIAILKAINRGNLAEATKNFFFKYQKKFPEEGLKIRPADRQWVQIGKGKGQGYMRIKEPPHGENLGLLVYLRKGRAQGYYVEKWIADAFDRNPIEGWWFGKAMSWIAHPFRMVYTELNPGFMLYNTIFRDLMRAGQMLPQASIKKFIPIWLKSLKPAAQSLYGIPPDIVEEMLKNNMLISIEGARGLSPRDREIERMLARYKFTPLKWRQKIMKPFGYVLNLWANVGRTGERSTKIASYRYLKENFPDMPIELMRHLVLTRGGSPAFLRVGRLYPLYNNILLFSNAMKEGYRGDYEAMAETPTEFWWKKTKYIILPKLLMWAAKLGLLGLGTSYIMNQVSKYDMKNYLVIPLGVTPNGDAVILRIPTDEGNRLIGGVLMTALDTDDPKYKQNLADYMAGQAPTLNPAISAAIAAVQYYTGRNPYDSFRGRFAIPDQIFRADDEHTRKAFVTWLANKYGSNIIYKFKYDDLDRVKGELETVLDYPFLSNIVGRFIKVTSAGTRERIKEVREIEKKLNARKNLDAKDVLTKWLNKEDLTEDDIMALIEKPDVIDRNLIKYMARKYGDVVAEELWSVYQTGTFEEKEAVWRLILEMDSVDLPNEGYRWLWQIGPLQGVKE